MKNVVRGMMALVMGITVTFPPVGQAGVVQLPAATPVLVKLTEIVSSATHKKGDKIALEVAADVVINGQKVIAAGTKAEGEVTNASKRFFLGVGGQLDIVVQRTTAVNGTVVPLQFEKGEHDGSSVLPVILGMICCICVLLFPGKDVQIDKDSIFNATTVGPVELHL